MQKHIVLGTAGHIDHGKTSLIRVLSGIDTDRLPEERARGITIELGFAHIDIPGGIRLGIVDVPGHEKFVHHMVAGVGGMDMVLLVIAADEGIMPQTREHLSICRLLGIRRGLVALTKIDMVETEWLELVQEDVRDFLSDTFLKEAPIIPVSSVTGAGLDSLLRAVSGIAEAVEPRLSSGTFRLPIDRVFTIRGFGTVVTGTVSGGSVSDGEILRIAPCGLSCKIRGLQVHGSRVDRIEAGQRAAVNIQNIDKDSIHRGMMLVRPGSVPETNLLDAECMLLESVEKPLKNRALVRFHSGTAEIIGRAALMDRDLLVPGETAFVQFRLPETTAVLPDDRYIIRSYSPVATIGGGRVLDPEPAGHKRLKPETIALYKNLASPVAGIRFLAVLDSAGLYGLTETDLKRRLPDSLTNPSVFAETLSASRDVHLVAGPPVQYISRSNWEIFKQKLFDATRDFHRRQPLRPGIGREELRTSLKPHPPEHLFSAALNELIAGNSLVEESHHVRIHDFSPSIRPDQEHAISALTILIKKAGTDGVTQKEIAETMMLDARLMKQAFQYLIDNRIIQRLPGGLIMDTGTLDAVRTALKSLFVSKDTVTVGDFRDAMNISRKQAVPLLEYFDSIGVTRRKGDFRILRDRSD